MSSSYSSSAARPVSYRPGLGQPSSSSSGTPHRRHSLFGTEDRIIIDIGSRYCKVGFSGEAQPRKVFKTFRGAQRPGLDASLQTPRSSGSRTALGDDPDLDADELLWDLDICKARSQAHLRARKDLLKARLTVLLRHVYQDVLMTDPSQRKVILVENPLIPSVIREYVYEILFDNLRVPSVSPMSAPLLSVFGTGSLTGLVVSVGTLETSILPIYHGRPLLGHYASTTRGGRRLERRLRALLLHHARYIAPSTDNSPAASFSGSIKDRTTRLDKTLLTQTNVEEVLIKCCFVSDPMPASASSGQIPAPATSKPLSSQKAKPHAESPPDWQLPHTGDHANIRKAEAASRAYDEAEDAHYITQLKQRYAPHSSARPLVLPLRKSPPSFELLPTKPATLLRPSGPSAPHQFGSRGASFNAAQEQRSSFTGDIIVPGWVRERVAEIFWEEEDEDEVGLSTLILSTLINLPIDLRRDLASSVLVTGGPCSLPGFAQRVRLELLGTLDSIPDALRPLSATALNVTAPGTPSRALAEAASPRAPKRPAHLTVAPEEKEQGLKGASSPRLRWFEQSRFAPLKSLRDYIAVVNDHHPPLDSSGRPAGGQGRGGTAPSISPVLHAWFGASLAGALKLSSAEETKREEWDSARLAEREAAAAEQRRAQEAANREKEKDKAARPTWGAGGRGSFMGVVGGLETGAFGGLAAVSRHMGRDRERDGGMRSPPTSPTPASPPRKP